MRQTFRGYYRPTEDDFSKLWETCVFIPDANVLLNIYRYTPATCDELLNIFTELSERLWVTHQAALEYHRQRLNVIGQQESAYEKIKKTLGDLQNSNEKQLKSFTKHPYIHVNIFSEKIENTLTEIKNELDECKKKHPNLLDTDKLRDKITALFEGKVGTSYSPEELKELYGKGEKRYKEQIPPGFSDKSKGNVNQFGDLIIWFQIIDYAKSIKKPIVFITDDRKEDWWLEIKGKTIGPKPELIDEIYEDAGVDFYMYQTEQFMTCAEKFLKREVNKDAIKEVHDIKRLDEEHKEILLKLQNQELKEMRRRRELDQELREMRRRRELDQELKEMRRRRELGDNRFYSKEMDESNPIEVPCWRELDDDLFDFKEMDESNPIEVPCWRELDDDPFDFNEMDESNPMEMPLSRENLVCMLLNKHFDEMKKGKEK